MEMRAATNCIAVGEMGHLIRIPAYFPGLVLVQYPSDASPPFLYFPSRTQGTEQGPGIDISLITC